MDSTITLMTLCVIALLAVFPIRNNDIWWHMAVGKLILATRAFISTDPFSFTMGGHPWTPQSYLAGIVFYLVYAAGSAPALIALRVLLVLGIFLVMIRILARGGFHLALASPVLLLAAFAVQSRFIIRPHLFEYLFIALLAAWLVSLKKRRGVRWYLLPVMLQILWVNIHPSFFLGPVIVFLFFAGEGIVRLLSRRFRFLASSTAEPFELKPALILFALMILACFISPDPVHFITQPLNAEQRELMTRYTLEWRSPFDPALRSAAFHPYFEMLLALAGTCFFLGVRRLHLASLLAVGFLAALSLYAHRFRFEFAVVAVPLMLMQFKDSPLGGRLTGALSGTGSRAVFFRVLFALAACGALISTGHSRFVFGGSVAERYPQRAFEFMRSEDIGHRSFHSIGFGSYLIWDLYPERKTFIDGRNYSAGLYRDFLSCQTDLQGFDQVTRTYELDSFVLPAPAGCDAGMLNVHRFLTESPGWRLVYLDRIAYIYVAADAVPAAWLDKHAFRLYHPLTFGPSRVTTEHADRLIFELERAAALDPGYYRPWIDLGSAFIRLDRPLDALGALEHAAVLEPGNHSVWHNIGVAAARARWWERAAVAFEREAELVPDRIEAHLALARVYLELGRFAEAEREANRAGQLDPRNQDAEEIIRELENAREGS